MDSPVSNESELNHSLNAIDCVRARLQKEGREARNLIAYSLPLENHKSFASNLKKIVNKANKQVSTHKEPKKLSCNNFKQVKRQRSASAGRDPQACLRARHWGFLFRNLGQAVDEIYQTCEDDESIIECKEAIMMLERYSNDFHNLIQWFNLKWEYENTLPPQRPTSLTWEIRTSSPGKIQKTNHKTASINDTKRILRFDNHKSEGLKERNSYAKDADSERNFEVKLPNRAKDESYLSPSPSFVICDKIVEESVADSNLLYESPVIGKSKDFYKTKEPKFTMENDAVTTGPDKIEIDERQKSNESLHSEAKEIHPLVKSCNQIKDLPKCGNLPTKDSATQSKLHISVDSLHIKEDAMKPGLTSSKSSENITKSAQHSKIETRVSSDFQQLKNVHIKPGPLVNMNKASQVRKAFNQNRTPFKPPCNKVWNAPNGAICDVKSTIPKHLSRGLVRSSTTLEGSQMYKKQWKKVPERSFCLESDKHPSNSSLTNISQTSSSGQSWADKVRGGSCSERRDSVSSLSLQDEDEGWEIVKRGRRSCGGSSASLNSQTPPNSIKGAPDKTIISKIKCKKTISHGYRAKSRFQQPTSAVSMPSLSTCEGTNRADFSKEKNTQSVKKSHINSKRIFKESEKCTLQQECLLTVDNTCSKSELDKQKSTSPHSEKCRKDASNLSKKNESQGHNKDTAEKIIDIQRDFNADIVLDSNRESGTDENGVKMDEKRESSLIVEKESEDDIEKQENEKMKTNAAALVSAENEEKRLKLEIEDTERGSAGNMEVCEVMEEEESKEASAHPIVHEEEFYQYNSKYAKLSSLSWADEMDVVEKMVICRPPGHLLHIHEKLSSPSRKLPLSEKFRRHKEKLAKAQDLREKLMQAKSEKLKELFKRISEVNSDKERLILEKRDLFERKMERAEEKRRCHLRQIVTKAHDEENKSKEIAFINGLEAQNKLHDIMQLQQLHESRLADRAEERCRKQEEKAAKEAAAQERRKAIEAERVARLQELCERRRRRCERIDRQQAERREEILEHAREKAKDREERLTALQQAQLAKESELVKKIQQKQEETARRHEENMEQIRQKALESSILKFSRGCDDAPKILKYETKRLCTLCNTLIASEVYLKCHLRGKQHRDALKELHKREVTMEESESCNIKFIIDAPANINDPQETRDKERIKTLKKRCRKIRARMSSRAEEFLKGFKVPTCKESPLKQKMKRAISQICKLLSSQGSGPWPTCDVTLLDRHLLELLRILENSSGERVTFASLSGFERLLPLLGLITANEKCHQPCVVPYKSLTFCARVLLSACRQSVDNCLYMIFSNSTSDLIEKIMTNFNEMSADSISTQQPSDTTTATLMDLLAEILNVITETAKDRDEPQDQIMQDIVSYCVCMGITDKISWYFNHVQNPIDNDPPSAQIIMAAMSLLSALSGTITPKSKKSDPTQLIMTFEVMEACGVVSLMYGSILHQGGRSPSPPPEGLLTPSTLAITEAATTFLQNLAELDLTMFQLVLGSEGISLELRHICSFLLWYCSKWPSEELLHKIISLVGYFTFNNKENQMVVQSGEIPSVLQQLCSLPWQYFSEPKLKKILFPTLLSCCLHNEDNLNVLQQEMSFQVLEDFLRSDESPTHPLMKIFRKNLEIEKRDSDVSAQDLPKKVKHSH